MTVVNEELETLLWEVVQWAAPSSLDRPTRRLERALGATWRRQGRIVVARLKSRFVEAERHGATAKDVDRAFADARSATRVQAERDVDEALRKAYEEGALVTIGETSAEIEFSLESPRATAWLRRRAASKVKDVDEATRRGLRSLLARASSEGWSWTATARGVESRFAGFSKPVGGVRSRAELVAMTETAEAYEAGHAWTRAELSGAGLKVQKRWITVGDDRVDPDCRANADGGWIGWDESFSSGAEGAPDHPGCRCVTVTRTKGDRG